MKIEYIFNKTNNVNPLDRKSIFIEVNYDLESVVNQSFPQVGKTNLQFAREDVSLFYNWIKGSGQGVFYAPYFDINLSDATDSYTVPLYFDLTNGFEYSADGIATYIRLYMGLDWLNDRVDGFTFESVIENPLTANDNDCAALINAKTIYLPYVISTVPNYLQAFTGIMTSFSMVMMLEKEVDVIVSL